MSDDTAPINEVKALVEQLTAQRELVRSATRKCSGLATIIRGYIEMYPEELGEFREFVEFDWEYGAAPRPAAAPKGADAAGRILQETPGYKYYVSEVVEALRARDWLPESDNPANAVRAALERLVASTDSDVSKYRTQDGKVVYFYDPDLDRTPTPNQAPAGYDPAEEPF